MADTNQSREYRIKGNSSEGVAFLATVCRISRALVVFEIYDSTLVLRASESLNNFLIILGEREVYSGRAILRNQINDGSRTVCEAKLDESAWAREELELADVSSGKLQQYFSVCIEGWQQLYRVMPGYKIAIADLHSFLSGLRLTIDQVELGLAGLPSEARRLVEPRIASELAEQASPVFHLLFERSEREASLVQDEALPAHQLYARRLLHPLISISPFFNRCFCKPLGYAGDYEVVNMMMREPCEGATLFAKVLNLWFLAQPPVIAHRKRIDLLVERLVQFAARVRAQARVPRIASLGCGPAHEIQRFLSDYSISDQAEFTLLDFDGETLRYTEKLLSSLRLKHSRGATFHFVKKSVHQLLRAGARMSEPDTQFDLVYCAGLFDYLSDQVCHRLLAIMYQWLTPGGILIATNVTTHNPSRGWMEHVTDWHLVYRDTRQMRALSPIDPESDHARIFVEPSAVNIFLELEKPREV